MLEITREDLEKVVDNKLFQMGVRFCIEDGFDPNLVEYDGNVEIQDIASKFKDIPVDKRYDGLENRPLPFYSYYDDPNEYEMLKGLCESAVDKYEPSWYCFYHQCHIVAVFILYPLMKILYPERKIYLYAGDHVFLINDILSKFKGINDFSLTRNLDQPCIIDIISQCYKEQLNEVFPKYKKQKVWTHEEWIERIPWNPEAYIPYKKEKDEMTKEKWENYIFDDKKLIPEDKICSWYTNMFKSGFAFDLSSHNKKKQQEWFLELLKL